MADVKTSRRPRASKTLEERFWSKVDKNGPVVREELGPCWVWTGHINTGGYGQIDRGGKRHLKKQEKAHRISYELHYSPIPGGLMACHKCDNRSCVNPSHLFLGTHIDNSLDKVRKGRAARKLSEEDVIQILSERIDSVSAVARRFGVSRQAIQAILRGKTWAHLRPANDNGVG